MNALLVICGLGVVSLLAEVVNAKRWLTTVIVLGLIAAAGLVTLDWGTSRHHYYDMMVFDNFSIAFTALIAVVAVFWFWMSADYFKDASNRTDRSALVVFSVSGAAIMVSFNNMAMLFLGIEILSISLYVLAGSRKDSLFSNEAAFKYFLMGSFATGFLLMGIALVYGATGSFDITVIGQKVAGNPEGLPSFFYAGVLMMLIGMAFKMSAVPFHFWAPDVYEGSPSSVTAFMSTVVKIAAFASFYRVFSTCFSSVQSTWLMVVQVIAVLTLVLANVTAVYQSSVKRMLAYSSVGHVGYILLAFFSDDKASATTIFYYLTAYSVASLAAFGVVMTLERSGVPATVDNFAGLFKRNPLLAVGMTVAMLSLAGIPPLGGFFGKYLVFTLAINNGYTALVIVAILTSLIGVYYYFRVIIAMFFGVAQSEIEFSISTSQKVFILLLILISIVLGVFPDCLLSLSLV